mgnify:CR=1 FL=1
MTISPTTTATAQTNPAAVTSTDVSSSNSVLSSDFETFLQMLTAQARYQDPLEPIDSSEYAAQLAQFSMVEQQVMSNDLLTALMTQLGTSNMGQLAGVIGMEARTTSPVQYDGTPITVAPNPAAVADEVFLVAYDSDGNEVQRISLPVSADPVEWDGLDENGDPLPSGTYSFGVESHADGELLILEPAEAYGRVTEARTQGGQSVLILEGGSMVLASDVNGLREPRG